MAFLASTFASPVKGLLVAAALGGVAVSCTRSATPPAAPTPYPETTATQLATLSATPVTDYSVDALILKRDKQPGLSLQVTYPHLRPRPGTAPADTLGVRAFNREAKALVEGLVKEIEAKARENRREKVPVPTALQVSFRAYLLQQGLASVAFTIGQDGMGPGPITGAAGLTYDLRKGRKLLPADLFRQNTAFKTLVVGQLKPTIAGVSGCQLEPDNLVWDNFALDPQAYYLLLGDAQIGRACGTRVVRVPLAKLRPFAVTNSPAERLQ